MSGSRVKAVTSASNPLVREALAVARGKGGPGLCLIEGPRVLASALDAAEREPGRVSVERVYQTAGFAGRHPGIIARLAVDRVDVPPEIMQRLTETGSPQGVAAICRIREWGLADLIARTGPMVLAERVQDPGNMGTIVRAADAVRAAGVIVLPGSADPFGPKAIRASAGSVLNLPVIRLSEATEAMDALDAMGVALVAALAHGGVDLFSAEIPRRVCFVLGNEGAGLDSALRARAALRVRVPMPGHAESLNVAMTATVLLYDWLRRYPA